MKTLKPLTDSDKIDVELSQAFDICICAVPADKWQEYNEASKNSWGNKPDIDFEAYRKDAVNTLVSKNFEASILPGNSIVLKINTFQTCFTIEAVPDLQKRYNSNLKRTANTYYSVHNGTDKTIKTYKNIGNLLVKPLEMALRFNSADEVKAEVLRTESNIISANNDINITPKLATSKGKPALLKVFTDELKYWQEVLKIAEQTDYADMLLQRECDNNEAIKMFTASWNNSNRRDTYEAYLNKRKVFDWFKFYGIEPVNDIDIVLQMYYANEIKENYSGNINQLIQEKQDYADQTTEKTKKMRASGAYYTLIAGLKKTQEQIKFLSYNKSEIETFLNKS